MDLLLPIIFWSSIAALFYIYAGYPLLIAGLAKLRPWQRMRQPHRGTVSVVLAIHNEAHHLQKKLKSLFNMQGADQLVEVLLGSDGSTDDTAALIAGLNDSRVRLIPFNERRGKPAVLNDLIPQARGEFVLLTDARQEFDAGFLTEALANFADERVGVVSGELVFRTDGAQSTAAEGIGLYWRYEKFLRSAESHFRGVPGATGACYLIRAKLFRPIPPTTILDDVAIPLTIVAQGARCVFERNAIAYDRPSQTPRREAIRKRRTIAGAAQLIRLYPRWLWPGAQPLWFEYVSHKLARLASPLLLIVALAVNLALLAQPHYQVTLGLQLAGYLGAVCGALMQRIGRRSAVFGPFLMFWTLNYTTLLALLDASRARYRVTWTKAGA